MMVSKSGISFSRGPPFSEAFAVSFRECNGLQNGGWSQVTTYDTWEPILQVGFTIQPRRGAASRKRCLAGEVMYLQQTLLEKSEKFPWGKFWGNFWGCTLRWFNFWVVLFLFFFGLEKIKVVTKITQPKDYEIKSLNFKLYLSYQIM